MACGTLAEVCWYRSRCGAHCHGSVHSVHDPGTRAPADPADAFGRALSALGALSAAGTVVINAARARPQTCRSRQPQHIPCVLNTSQVDLVAHLDCTSPGRLVVVPLACAARSLRSLRGRVRVELQAHGVGVVGGREGGGGLVGGGEAEIVVAWQAGRQHSIRKLWARSLSGRRHAEVVETPRGSDWGFVFRRRFEVQVHARVAQLAATITNVSFSFSRLRGAAPCQVHQLLQAKKSPVLLFPTWPLHWSMKRASTLRIGDRT